MLLHQFQFNLIQLQYINNMDQQLQQQAAQAMQQEGPSQRIVQKLIQQPIQNNNKQQGIQVSNTVQNNVPINTFQNQLQIATNFGGINSPQYLGLAKQFVPYQTTITQSPPMIKQLAKYTQYCGYKPYGNISGNGGVAYIGITQSKRGDQVIMTPFPKNDVMRPTVPNIPVQLKYYANRTINSWNDYIQKQDKLLGFMNKIGQTSASRAQYMQKQLKYLNLTQFQAQFLASLTFYYVYLPLLKFSKVTTLSGYSLDAFLQNYGCGLTLNENPLFLKKQQGRTLMQRLLNIWYEYDATDKKWSPSKVENTWKDLTPINLSSKVLGYLKNILYDNDKIKFQNLTKNVEKMLGYSGKRKNQANAFFKSQQIQSGKSQQLLSAKVFKVKQQKFIFKIAQRNIFLASIVDKVNTERKLEKNDKVWDQQWGSQFLYSFDYIWDPQY